MLKQEEVRLLQESNQGWQPMVSFPLRPRLQLYTFERYSQPVSTALNGLCERLSSAAINSIGLPASTSIRSRLSSSGVHFRAKAATSPSPLLSKAHLPFAFSPSSKRNQQCGSHFAFETPSAGSCDGIAVFNSARISASDLRIRRF